MRRHLGSRSSLYAPLRAALLGAIIAAALALTGSALAQSQDEIKAARQIAGDALVAYRAGEYEKALKLFEQARAAYPSAQILRMVGYTELALEHWEKSLEALEASLKSTVGSLPESDR